MSQHDRLKLINLACEIQHHTDNECDCKVDVDKCFKAVGDLAEKILEILYSIKST